MTAHFYVRNMWVDVCTAIYTIVPPQKLGKKCAEFVTFLMHADLFLVLHACLAFICFNLVFISKLFIHFLLCVFRRTHNTTHIHHISQHLYTSCISSGCCVQYFRSFSLVFLFGSRLCTPPPVQKEITNIFAHL